jgi:hypothetical protein
MTGISSTPSVELFSLSHAKRVTLSRFSVNTLHENLSIPVTAKFRVFPTIQKTVDYARMLERGGAQILTCHGRTREQRGHNSVSRLRWTFFSSGRIVSDELKQGLADWDKIRAVKAAVSVPVFANGNILYHSDIPKCLAITGADAVMSAESQLYNAALFAPAPPSLLPASAFDAGLHPKHADLALEYLSIVRSLNTKTAPSAVKGHLFKLMRPALAREKDLRDRLGKVRGCEGALDVYVEIAEEMKRRMDVSSFFFLCRGFWGWFLFLFVENSVARSERSGRSFGTGAHQDRPWDGSKGPSTLARSALFPFHTQRQHRPSRPARLYVVYLSPYSIRVPITSLQRSTRGWLPREKELVLHQIQRMRAQSGSSWHLIVEHID